MPDHAILASLSAKATKETLKGFRSFKSVSQVPKDFSAVSSRHETALAACIKSSRSPLFPRLDIPSILEFLPVEYCNNTNPSQTAKLRPLENSVESETEDIASSCHRSNAWYGL